MNTAQPSDTATTMTVWSQSQYGGPDSLTQLTAEVPLPGAGEVLVRVHATAVNSADVRIMRGEPYLIRLAFGLRRPKVAVQGRDVSGVVVSVGDGVTTHRVGDPVAGEVDGGGFAEYVVAPAQQLVAVPAGLDHRTAAALPLAGGTAWQSLEAAKLDTATLDAEKGAHLRPRLLVLGAGGGVGLYVSWLAVLRGATVHALASAGALGAVTAQGVEWAEDRRGPNGNEPIDRVLDQLEADSYDAIFELGGRTPLRSLRRLLTADGVIVGIAGGENRVFGPLGRIVCGAILSLGGKRGYAPLFATAKPEITEQLLALAAAGELTPVLSGELPLSEVPAALARIEQGGVVGKLVVTIPASERCREAG
jgi:NADPH:quinone reductase-like Zn-dependent oxidoreductase